jgi:hypothetical protein
MTCARCGHELPSPAPSFCPNCGMTTGVVEAAPGVSGGGPPDSGPPPPRAGLPWENRSGLLDLGAMFRTIGKVLFDAPAAYRSMKTDGGLGGPLFFAVLLGTICGWVALLWQLLFSGVMEGLMPTGGESPFGNYGNLSFMASTTFKVAQAVMLPGIILLVLFIIAAIYHLFLMMFGGAKRSFETTVRVLCFSAGSTAIFQLIPFCGGLIAFVWGLVIDIIGLAEAHETGTGKAAAAVLVPIAACCLCFIVTIAAAVALGVSVLGRS